ncbi:uncharacterized protein LOC112555785 [Pomacea canaliculata]|uniref:uncharacterized protein LOC112555785 n=1 Tax=Pomacea canaliculata TaxID=400727 RepID=UPI000D73A62E|nr:uncharacterized protein LOC112555785 [Pomacea canaliculata]XP_025080086.1 uncharacterized protein LOC112555785 [Pomacea canaliculata]
MAGGGWSVQGLCLQRRWLSVFSAIVAVLLLTSGHAHSTWDITAFEYYRKFHKYLDLGECPQREELIITPDNKTHVKPVSCNMHQKGNITSLMRELNDTRHVIIPTATDLVAHLGLCVGEAASYLGILNNGDCIAVEIASKLTFSSKTMVRAYVEYYRKSLDILDTTPSLREGFETYYADKYYVKYRSYGTLEIILVQFRFRSQKETEAAKELRMTSNLMSDFMKKVEREVGVPQRVLVVNLSTATQNPYTLDKYSDKEWEAAIREVELKEMMVKYTQMQIVSGRLNPHLHYQLFPFLISGSPIAGRGPSPLTWEATSMLEVSLRRSISTAKKTAKKCRKNSSRLCRRVRELRRKLVTLQAEIHKGRLNWVKLTNEEKRDFASRYTARVSTFANVTKSLSQAVHRMKKQEKLDKLNTKKRRRNQVPLDGVQRLRLRRKRARTQRLSRSFE